MGLCVPAEVSVDMKCKEGNQEFRLVYLGTQSRDVKVTSACVSLVFATSTSSSL